jgi:type II secretory pathway pseudopilin PulG
MGDTTRSRVVVAVLLMATVLIALAPRWWGSGGRGEMMRQGLEEALSSCRAAYDSAATPADTARVDSMVPTYHGVVRAGDPACGAYREKRMFRRGR